MRVLQLIASAVLAMAAAGPSTHIARAQTGVEPTNAQATSAQSPGLACTQASDALDGVSPPAIGPNAFAALKIDPSQAEAACRAVFGGDPANPTFMFQLARALSLGNKRLEAMKYYMNAAEHGHAGAMNDLGGVFEYGLGVPKNLATGLLWYERAAALGHAGAMIHLGQLSEQGRDVPQDFANARSWYEKAAALGNAVAMNDLADLLRYGRGAPADLAAAARWYLKAARLGLPGAMNSFGELNEAGMGVAQDFRGARSWYQKAAELGSADAMGHLGALFESGQGGAQSLETAREWYVKGAALNGRVAMHNLGAMLENGRGTPPSLTEAASWYVRAAALEYPPALNDLGRLFLAGAGVPRNYLRAKAAFEQAARLGDAKAMNNLGLLYLNGRGVQRNIDVARNWFQQAIALDNVEARKNLKVLEETAPPDGAQVAARRTSCMQTCVALHRSYVTSVCDHYPATADDDRPERVACISASLTLARQCRDSCREWAATALADNKCEACFHTLIACSISQEPADGQANERSYAVDSKPCLAASAQCTAKCHPAAAATPAAPDATAEKPDQ
jgi:uncharacterized protein